LACVREDGSKKDKTEKFNSKKRKSGEFNLWVRSLFQSPLLGYGSNKIHYELTKEDKSVLSGDFTAQVHKNDSRECSRGHFYSSNLNDCYNPGSFCSEYFYIKNYCK
ncbi:MAG: hypothetical protein HY072_06390, partial [Deltaproteobacteria bacterium]|nr:hypothetical protein [Deltaproteobacteria bacterium]